MESNVWGRNDVLRERVDLRDYSWQQGTLPEGKVWATHDLKVWTKAALGISCYFRVKATGQKIRLTLFRKKDSHNYQADSSPVDFKTCAYGQLYRLVICKNGKENYILSDFETAI